MILYSVGKSLLTGRLRIALVFLILTIAPFTSEFLLGNTPVTMTIFRKVSPFHHKLAEHNFLGVYI